MRQPLSQFPSTVGDWTGRDGPEIDRDTLAGLGVNEFVNRIYERPGERPAALYVGYYASQRQGDTIHSPLNCLPGAGWEPVRRTRVAIAARVRPADNQPGVAVVNQLIIQKGADRELVLYWYQGHGRVIASEYWGRALLVMDALRLNRTDGALVRLIVPIDWSRSADEGAAAHSAASFAQALIPLLGQFLPQ